MIDNAYLIVDECAVKDNTKLFRMSLNEKTQVIAVIKANGYGLGLIQVAHLCESMGIEILAVLDVNQGKALRDAGISIPILLLGAVLEENFSYLHEYDLIQVIINHDYALRMSDYAIKHNVLIKTHVKHDTGLHRLGMRDYDEIKSCYSMPGLDVQGIYSHFVAAQSYDEDDLAFSRKQIDLFNDLLKQLKEDGIDPGLTHLQNSPAVLNFGDLGYDAVRCGMIMFGLYHPSQLELSKKLGYKEVLSYETRVCMINHLKQGDPIGYGRTYVCEKDTTVATISSGYCDGIMKGLSLNGGGVVINDVLCPIVGDIAMSQFMVDVSNVDCKLEDTVIVFGHPKQDMYDTIDKTKQSINEFISHFRQDMKRIYRK